MTARKIAIAKFFCFSFVLSALCFAPGPAHSQEREKLRVSTLFIGSSLVPLWIAQEQGIFARNGVDVELIWMQSTLSTTALLAGEVDVVFGTPQTILAVLTAKNPPPLVTVPLPHRPTQGDERNPLPVNARADAEAVAVADWEWYADYPRAIGRVSAEDLRRVARTYLQEDSLTSGFYLPKSDAGAPQPVSGEDD